MIYWAIKYIHARRDGYIDPSTIRCLRRDAWAAHYELLEDFMEPYKKMMRDRHRKGTIRAVKIEVREIES